MIHSFDKPRDMLGRAGIVSFAEAMKILHSNLPHYIPAEEELPLEATLGRVTSRKVSSPEDLPSHPRATMDGYAVHASDTFGATESMPAYLEISGEVVMGEYPSEGPSSGACFKIATGGILPPHTEAVVMLEHTVTVDERMIEVTRPAAVGENVIVAGEDLQKGDLLLPAGRFLRPHDLGLLAGLGITTVFVRRKIKIGIISTGDEIVPYQESPPPGKIRDINSVNLAALIKHANALPVYYGIVADDESRLEDILGKAMSENDLVLFSGSSSVGTRDLGERVLSRLGGPGIFIHGVALKPGKPVIIALVGDKLVFGLPGHPVSAAVIFDLFVRPALKHFAGLAEIELPERRTIKARFMRNVNSAAGRMDVIRVKIRPSSAGKPVEAHPVLGKSGALSTMVQAHGHIIIGEKQQGVREGEMVEVQLFD